MKNNTKQYLYLFPLLLIPLFLWVILQGEAQDLSGPTVLFPYQGGTGTSTTPVDLQVLVGRGDGSYYLPILTAGSNITIATSTSALTITSTASGAFATTTADYWGSQRADTAIDWSASGFALDATGAWTGTFDGYQGVDLLTRADFYATTTSEIAEGTNLYSTLTNIQSACTNDFHNIGGTDANTTYTAANPVVLNGTVFGVESASTTLWETDTTYTATLPLSIVANDIQIDVSGNWTGTLDGIDSTGFLTRADYYTTTTDGLSEGSTNKYYSTQLFATDLAATTTDALTEGTGNLYFTNARVDAHLTGGTAITYSAGDISVTGDSIGDTQLAYNTGQHLTTTAIPTFNELTLNYGLTAATTTLTGKLTTVGFTSTASSTISGDFTAGNTTQLFVDADGFIGIASSTPSSTFAVQGEVTIVGDIKLSGTLKETSLELGFTYSTSSWEGVTTTQPIGAASKDQTITGAFCYSDAGSVTAFLTDGTNAMDFIIATSSIGYVVEQTVSTNNLFEKGDKRYIVIGSEAGGTTEVSCTFVKNY